MLSKEIMMLFIELMSALCANIRNIVCSSGVFFGGVPKSYEIFMFVYL